MLERSLIPPILPVCPGIRLAARYVAAEDRAVGGDWYDVFVLPSGELWVIVGDVAGRGLSAAVTMGNARSVLRSYALLGRDPDEVLALADAKLGHFEPGTVVTAVCAVATPPFDTVRLSSAGHLPPLLTQPGVDARFVELPADLPLGAGASAPRSSKAVVFPPEGLLLLYTDGLLERSGESLEERLEQLRSIVAVESPEAVCQRVMGGLMGTAIPNDDIALIVLGREPQTS